MSNIDNESTVKNTGGYDKGISFCRLIAMLLIISCHVLQYYGNELAWWLNSGVQMFICISGFLYGQRQIISGYRFIKNRFTKILVSYYVCVIIDVFALVLFADNAVNMKGIIGLIFCRGTILGLGHLWFVGTILFCYLLTPFLYSYYEEVSKQKYSIIIYLISLGVLFIAIELHVPQFNPIWVLCYIIGFFLGKLKINDEKWIYKAILIITPLSISLNAFRVYFNYVLCITFEKGLFKVAYSCFENISHIFLGIMCFLILYYTYIRIVYRIPKISRVLELSDKYSYDIYLSHHVWILGPISILNLSVSMIWKIIFVIMLIVMESMMINICAKRIISGYIRC